MNTNRWRLDGQTALITGASAGIGLAIARELLGFGADLLLVARDADALAQARDDLADEFPDRAIHGLSADVADDEDRQAILDWVEDHGGLNLLVNNAGGNITRPANDYSEDEWRGIFETNLFSAFELSRYAYPLLTRHASSAIVNVGSVSGITHVRSGVVYGMTKAAMQQMTVGIAHVAEQSGAVSSLSKESGGLANGGNQAVKELLVEMRRISESVNQSSSAIEALGKESEKINSVVPLPSMTLIPRQMLGVYGLSATPFPLQSTLYMLKTSISI